MDVALWLSVCISALRGMSFSKTCGLLQDAAYTGSHWGSLLYQRRALCASLADGVGGCHAVAECLYQRIALSVFFEDVWVAAGCSVYGGRAVAESFASAMCAVCLSGRRCR